MAQIGSLDLNIADHVTIDGVDYILGQNLVTNPSFDSDPSLNGNQIVGWQTGTYAQMTTSDFTWMADGGQDGGACIRAKSSKTAASTSSLGTRWGIEPGKLYYFRYWVKGLTGENIYVPVLSITDKNSTAAGQNEYLEDGGSVHGITLVGQNGNDPSPETMGSSNYNTDGSWCMTSVIFESTQQDVEATYLQYNARWLGSGIYFDDFYLGELYDVSKTDTAFINHLAEQVLHEEYLKKVVSKRNELSSYKESVAGYTVLEDQIDEALAITMPDLTTATTDELRDYYNNINERLEAVRSHRNTITLISNTMIAIESYLPTLKEYPTMTAALNGILSSQQPDYKTAPYEEVLAYYNKVSDTYELQQNGFSSIATLKTKLTQAEHFLQTTCFPGVDDFSYTIEQVQDVAYDNYGTANDYMKALEEISSATLDYLYSQVPTASNPADYSFYIQHRHFVNDEAEPYQLGNGAWVYPNVGSYTNGSSPSDGNSTGWVTGTSGGDQRTNYVQQRTCWNAWRTSFDYVSISQTISDLPAGKYIVKADMLTQKGCITDQHLFAVADADTIVSEPLASDDWATASPYDGKWDSLQTDTIEVKDGTLTIGAIGHGDSANTPTTYGGTNTDYRRGWFVVTNFQLMYCGDGSDKPYVPTGIEEAGNSCTSGSDDIYTIQGQRIHAPQKGINIINGKKILVK